jgi:hypothetical protein
MQTTVTTPDKGGNAAVAQNERGPLVLRKRIGSTVFIVNVRFSDKTTETLEDKILRLIEGEVLNHA